MRFAIIWEWVPGGKPDIDFRAGGGHQYCSVFLKSNTPKTPKPTMRAPIRKAATTCKRIPALPLNKTAQI